MKEKPFHYEICCVNANGDDISEMVDRSRPITYRTFFKHVSKEEVLELFPVYGDGLTIKQDWAVQYARSRYQGRPCYYLIHSAIEYVFTEP